MDTETPDLPAQPEPPKKRKPTPTDVARAVLQNLRAHFDGNDALAVDFARCYAGLVVRFPASKLLEQILNQERSHAALLRDPSSGTVRRLADAQGTSMKHVAVAFRQKNGKGLRELRADRAVEGGTSDDEPADDAIEREA